MVLLHGLHELIGYANGDVRAGHFAQVLLDADEFFNIRMPDVHGDHQRSSSSREVAQHGRRGALMITMDIRHPDIEKFISIKQDLSKVTGANISVRISDEFMQAVEQDHEFMLSWPLAGEPQITSQVKARELWDTII